MLDLTWHGDEGMPWVDFARNRIWIPAAYNKSDAEQSVPLHPDLAEILKPFQQRRDELFRLSDSPVRFGNSVD